MSADSSKDKNNDIERADASTTVPPNYSTIGHSRIFMNHVDQFNAIHIAEYLTDQIFGALRGAAETGADEGAEEEEEAQTEKETPLTVGDKYEIVGTLKFPFARKTEDILFTVPESDAKVWETEILNSAFVVYDITKDSNEIPKALAALNLLCEQIESVKEMGPKTFSRYDRQFLFVLICNFMSWARTKPIDPDDPETPFTEADYRKRKPNPNYQQEINCEHEVILRGRKYKENLKTYVVCAGIPYGFEEDDLFFLFKLAWSNQNLPIFGPGDNIIPLIHIQDLAKVLYAILELQPKKPNYILAVEQIPCTLAKVVKALSKGMGRGGVLEITKEEAFLYSNMTQRIFDLLTVNLKMEPAFIIDELGIEYRSDLNLAQNMTRIVSEFRIARKLKPMKILIHGKLGSGKTSLARSIAEYYSLHYINVGTMIKQICDELKTKINEITARKSEPARPTSSRTPKRDDDDDEEEVDEEGSEGEDGGDLEDLKQRLAAIETAMERSPDKRLPDEFVIRLMRSFLASNLCQNRGYVLDGYPRNMKEVKELFAWEFAEDSGEGVEEGDEGAGGDKRSIVPHIVISLYATDEFVIHRVLHMEEKDTEGTHYEESEVLKRLQTFREENTEDNTLLNFFDEHEIHPITIKVAEESVDIINLLRAAQVYLGPPEGFGISEEDEEEMARCQQEANALKEQQQKIKKEIEEREKLQEYQEKMEERIRILEKLQAEEEKLLTVHCEPLRKYLMAQVFPTLTQGLLEVARVKPNDPVDYLAEYLFKSNPEGKMFDPMYTRQGELIDQVTHDVTTQKLKKRLVRLCK